MGRTVAAAQALTSILMAKHDMKMPQPLSAPPDETVRETPFYIAATGIGSRPRCSLKYGDTFLVVDNHGDIGAAEGGPDGLFHNDTRFLSRLNSWSTSSQPLLLGSNVRDDNTVLTADLTNPDIYQWRPDRSAEGYAAYRSHHLHVARHGIPADRHPQSRHATRWGCGSRFASTAISPTCSRCAG